MALRRNLTNLGYHTPFSFFSNENFIDQLCDIDENIKPWHNIKIELHLKDTQKNILVTNYSCFTKNLEGRLVLNDEGNAKNLVIFDNHVARKF